MARVGRCLEEDFYTDAAASEPTVESCLKDIERSRERHILRYKAAGGGAPDFTALPDKMGPDTRTAVARRFIYRWKCLFPRDTQLGRLLHPSPRTEMLMIDFARKPSTFIETLFPAIALASLASFFVYEWVSPISNRD